MYDLRQFRPMLYLVLILGISGFAVSASTPGLWLMAMLVIAGNALLLRSGRWVVLPGFATGAITVGALLYAGYGFFSSLEPPLMFIGEFLVYLQLVKLFEQRANRDAAQILVLSLLLMVAAAINTTSLAFAVVLVLYLFTALYCCLLFHLKVEADRAQSQFPVPAPGIPLSTLRQDRRFLSRSMRRLTALVAVVSLAVAAVVFLFFPRGRPGAALGQLQLPYGPTMTGFSERMDYQHLDRIRQDPRVVGHVTLWRDLRPWRSGQSLYLRGATYDVYGVEPRLWSRRPQAMESREITAGVRQLLVRSGLAGQHLIHQKISLNIAGGTVFALPGPVFFQAPRDLSLRINPSDETLRIAEQHQPVLEYEVWSTLAPQRPPAALAASTSSGSTSDPDLLSEVRLFTRQAPIVGPLGMRRVPEGSPREEDAQVAKAIETYLRRNYGYTLDLSGLHQATAGGASAGRDPLLVFLRETRQGQCGLFAGAMTVMCQSLGLQARLVVGYRCDDADYNPIGGYYVVRHSHAHAWVEVLTPAGWLTYDPTSDQDARPGQAGGWWRTVRNLLDFFEYKWAENVVAFDRQAQDDLIGAVDRSLALSALRAEQSVQSWRRWFNTAEFWKLAYQVMGNVLGILIGLLFLLLVGLVVGYIAWRWRLWRRARRIGLDTLPSQQRLALSRQLAFYDQLTQLLERHRLRRPRHLTALEFARALCALPVQSYHDVRRLTRIMYRVRFGGAVVPPARQHRLHAAVARVATALQP